MSSWLLASGSDLRALRIVDGTGMWEGHGPHYSRRTPGSRSFTGVGSEIVLVTSDESAVWSVVLSTAPKPKGSGSSRGRCGVKAETPSLWRNNVFRNLGNTLSSELIVSATQETYRQWLRRYGSLPGVRLRTEIDTRKVRSTNPGFCYLCAGWEHGPSPRRNRGLIYLYAPGPVA